MRIGVRLLPMGNTVKLEIRGAHAGPTTYCIALGRTIASGNRTFLGANGSWTMGLLGALFGSKRAVRRFLKANRPRCLVIESTWIPGIIEQCDTISKGNQ